jgi:hypothetical protein
MVSPDRKEVTALAEKYAVEEMYFDSAKVTALMEDGNGNYAARLTCTLVYPSIPRRQGRKSRDIALVVFWTGHKWVVETEFDAEEFDEKAAEPVRCGYCDGRTTRGKLIVSVCPTCHTEGIEC